MRFVISYLVAALAALGGFLMKVYFIGAGPGDPKLLTIKGKDILEQAEIVVYAGSLVNKDILKYAINAKEKHNSAS